ncbi:MAG: tetratricopeptide repeat protein, partial [Bacteroidota bacterium]
AMYQRVGSLLGEANCIQSLGKIAFRSSDNAKARDLFGRAIAMYQRVGDLLGEANCIRSLGKIAESEDDLDEATALFLDSLDKYQLSGAVYSVAVTKVYLSKIAPSEAAKKRLFDEAVETFARIAMPWEIDWAKDYLGISD